MRPPPTGKPPHGQTEFARWRGHPLLIVWLREHGLNADEVHTVRIEGDYSVVATVYLKDPHGRRYLRPGTDIAATRVERRALRADLWQELLEHYAELSGGPLPSPVAGGATSAG